MTDSMFDRKVDKMRGCFHALQTLTGVAFESQSAVLVEVLEELTTTLEELQVADEELRERNEELVASQQAVEAERQRYQDLFELAPDGYVVTDARGIILEANRAAAALLHLRQDFLIGKPLIVFVVGKDRQALHAYVTRLQQQLSTAQEWEAFIQPRSGEPFPATFTVGLVRDPQGKVVALRWLLRNATERKKIAEELRLAKEAAEAANQAKSEFLAIVSHELRTPLGVILGYEDLLLEGAFGPLTTEQTSVIQRVNRNANELHDLIAALLDLNRLEVDQLPIDFQEVHTSDFLTRIKEETEGLQEQSGLTFEWRIPDNLPFLRTDPGKLKMVIKNLLSNAVKFTQKGSVTVTAQHHENGVEVSIADTGVGIPREALTLIFEPFWQANGSMTRRFGGVGLGLHIVQRMLNILGGTVTVASEVDRGSTFRVWIPANTDS